MLMVDIRFIKHTMDDRRQLQTLVNGSTPAVVLLHDDAGPAGESAKVGRETSKVQTQQVLELSQEGCTFSASSPEALTPGAQLRTRIVADGTVLDLTSRVVHVSREG